MKMLIKKSKRDATSDFCCTVKRIYVNKPFCSEFFAVEEEKWKGT
jgi:hypothetical protein